MCRRTADPAATTRASETLGRPRLRRHLVWCGRMNTRRASSTLCTRALARTWVRCCRTALDGILSKGSDSRGPTTSVRAREGCRRPPRRRRQAGRQPPTPRRSFRPPPIHVHGIPANMSARSRDPQEIPLVRSLHDSPYGHDVSFRDDVLLDVTEVRESGDDRTHQPGEIIAPSTVPRVPPCHFMSDVR